MADKPQIDKLKEELIAKRGEYDALREKLAVAAKEHPVRAARQKINELTEKRAALVKAAAASPSLAETLNREVDALNSGIKEAEAELEVAQVRDELQRTTKAIDEMNAKGQPVNIEDAPGTFGGSMKAEH